MSSSVDGDVLFRMPLSMPLEIVSRGSFFKNRVLTLGFHEISFETPGRGRVVVPSSDARRASLGLTGMGSDEDGEIARHFDGCSVQCDVVIPKRKMNIPAQVVKISSGRENK